MAGAPVPLNNTVIYKALLIQANKRDFWHDWKSARSVHPPGNKVFLKNSIRFLPQSPTSYSEVVRLLRERGLRFVCHCGHF